MIPKCASQLPMPATSRRDGGAAGQPRLLCRGREVLSQYLPEREGHTYSDHMTPTPSTMLRPLEVDAISGSFFVPSYQRGYRWGSLEVTQLLDDLHASQGEAYYLQPIAVRRREDDSFELIDGQQRLTTLFLIKSHILSTVAPREKHKYHLEYETRPGSAAYLADPSEEGSQGNIDFLHMFMARNTIEEWFGSRPNPTIAAFEMYQHLAQNVYVIWYEIPEGEDGIELFRRLNVGKIPLTSAELIKASLLSTVAERCGPTEEISRGWDAIERELWDPQFWAFASGGASEPPTRISLILDAIGATLDDPSTAGGSQAPTHFSTFERSAPHIAGNPIAYWDMVLDTHSSLRSWFEDRDLFHLIGYLTATGTSVQRLLPLKEGTSTSHFRQRLVNRITEKLGLSTDALAELDYSRNRQKCVDVLLLFNVELSRTSSDTYARYPFAAHAAQKWSVEHITAQNAESLRTSEAWHAWISSHMDELERRGIGTHQQCTGMREELHASTTRSAGLTMETYLDMRRRIMEALGEVADDVHTIDNLALLTTASNSALGNDVFALKRRALIEMERDGHFIPAATRGVFQKYFSKSATPHLHLWDATDRADYFDAMRQALGPYLQETSL